MHNVDYRVPDNCMHDKCNDTVLIMSDLMTACVIINIFKLHKPDSKTLRPKRKLYFWELLSYVKINQTYSLANQFINHFIMIEQTISRVKTCVSC